MSPRSRRGRRRSSGPSSGCRCDGVADGDPARPADDGVDAEVALVVAVDGLDDVEVAFEARLCPRGHDAAHRWRDDRELGVADAYRGPDPVVLGEAVVAGLDQQRRTKAADVPFACGMLLFHG